MDDATPSEAAMQALVGHRFRGGTYRIEHWENFLLTEATGIDPLPDGLAHPIHLFHVAINGVGITIAEIFDLAESKPGDRVSIDHYDWTIHQPLREDVTYTLTGGVADFSRAIRDGATPIDSFTYEIAMSDPDGSSVADVSFGWHYWRRSTPNATA